MLSSVGVLASFTAPPLCRSRPCRSRPCRSYLGDVVEVVPLRVLADRRNPRSSAISEACYNGCRPQCLTNTRGTRRSDCPSQRRPGIQRTRHEESSSRFDVIDSAPCGSRPGQVNHVPKPSLTSGTREGHGFELAAAPRSGHPNLHTIRRNSTSAAVGTRTDPPPMSRLDGARNRRFMAHNHQTVVQSGACRISVEDDRSDPPKYNSGSTLNRSRPPSRFGGELHGCVRPHGRRGQRHVWAPDPPW